MRASTTTCLTVLLSVLGGCRMDNHTAASEGDATTQSSESSSGDETDTQSSEATEADSGEVTTDPTASSSVSTGDGDSTDTDDSADTSDPTDPTDVDTGEPVTDTAIPGDGDGDEAIYLFGTEETFTGTLGEATQIRPTVDAICQETLSSSGLELPCEAVHALISVDAEDPLYKIPSNYGAPAEIKIVGPDEDVITDGWDALILQDLQMSLADAGVLPPGVHWWSGATAEGGASSNCGGWTVLTVESTGIAGASSTTLASGWMSAISSECGAQHHLVCACW
jgi:hypothetical protein